MKILLLKFLLTTLNLIEIYHKSGIKLKLNLEMNEDRQADLFVEDNF